MGSRPGQQGGQQVALPRSTVSKPHRPRPHTCPAFHPSEGASPRVTPSAEAWKAPQPFRPPPPALGHLPTRESFALSHIPPAQQEGGCGCCEGFPPHPCSCPLLPRGRGRPVETALAGPLLPRSAQGGEGGGRRLGGPWSQLWPREGGGTVRVLCGLTGLPRAQGGGGPGVSCDPTLRPPQPPDSAPVFGGPDTQPALCLPFPAGGTPPVLFSPSSLGSGEGHQL